MAPKLYYAEPSPPVRSVLLTAKALGLELDLKPVNLFAGEHMTPEYLKINPQHTVPTLVDDGYILWDSHAINSYLVSKYGKDDSLYPQDLQKRGRVDQRLYFNCGSIQPRMGAIVGPIIRQGATTIPQDKIDLILQAYDSLETFLDGQDYLAGDCLTIADLCVVAPISSLEPFIPIDEGKRPNLGAWYSRIQALPYYEEANLKGRDMLVGFIKSKLT